ncbi:MAG: hypothetical protein IPN71_08190 [Fibrobacteres bacterium]|nr:hypothetical protein [Fibrobacterota bacterium]
MGMKIVASAGQLSRPGAGSNSPWWVSMTHRGVLRWRIGSASGRPRGFPGLEKPVGFSGLPNVLMTDVVEFPVEPGEWILMAKNGKDPSVKFHYTVGAVSGAAKDAGAVF